MAIRTYREAVKEALAQEMALDDRVVLIGEDVCGGQAGTAEVGSKGEAFGGVLGVTKGLWTDPVPAEKIAQRSALKRWASGSG